MPKDTKKYKCPSLAVDAITGYDDYILLIERKNPPHGWALPGGFVDYGESVEDAVARELKEETGLDFSRTDLLGVYSDPNRDPRSHVVSIVFIGKYRGIPKAADDAKNIKFFHLDELPKLAFDHTTIIDDYKKWRRKSESNLSSI